MDCLLFRLMQAPCLMHADNRRVDHLQSDIMGAQILLFVIQADIPQTKSILAKSSPWRSQS
ncbi:hypothetical protein CQ12_41265 [Bradyrhizobium jicamae]|uniref:Uncharacterized protein n=1 Tax=Bradyrhizobium jicamae TaxID=280332 RepID=A0A0R3LJR3_9BRAD|nr:hypothetical protein CQ12_41265 [Bradyrhizobium jicamae]